MEKTNKYMPVLKDIMTAERTLGEILEPTPLQKNRNLSQEYGGTVYLKNPFPGIFHESESQGEREKQKDKDNQHTFIVK